MKINLKNAVLRGTIILTVAGILSRIIGFYYRIFLTRSIGAEGMGLFQLVMPILGIAFALCSAGVTTAISKFCAENKERYSWLPAGLVLSLPFSILIAFLTYIYSDFLATNILLNPGCASLIRILAFTIPFSTFHNCVNGYYFGLKRAGIPAFSQLFEQVVRVAIVYAYVYYCTVNHRPITVICALYGNFAGEIGSTSFCIIAMIIDKYFHMSFKQLGGNVLRIFKFSVPLTANRLLMHLLQSGEAILIPAQLMVYGHSSTEALSIYGILTGMALPLILFPSAITNSLSVMLLPEVSGAQSANDSKAIVRTLDRSIQLCMLMGIVSTLVFLVYGGKLGAIIFKEPSVNTFILVLAWLCPFSYLATTLGSILNGLGKTTLTCIQNILGIVLRIACLILLVPKYGIAGYLWGLLFSQILVCLCHYIKLFRMFDLRLHPFSNIVLPILYSVAAIGASLLVYVPLLRLQLLSEFLRLTIGGLCACTVFILIIRFTKLRNL
jgi:stage V sporulation protein B